jgi:hypothetical protein
MTVDNTVEAIMEQDKNIEMAERFWGAGLLPSCARIIER